MQHLKCQVCDSAKYEKRYIITRSEGTFRIVKCSNCGHIYQNPRLNEKHIKKSYDKQKEFYRSMPRKNNRKSFELICSKRLKKIESFFIHPSHLKILDIGCAFGTFVETAEKMGWEAHGVELSKHIASFAKNKMHLKVFNGTLEKARYQKEFFDVITMFDVIEHVPDPKKTLMECNRILKNQGLIVIQTPAVDSLYSMIKGKHWDYFGLQHLNYFSTKSMEKILEAAGFKIIKIYYGDEIGFINSIRAYFLNKEIDKKTTKVLKFMLAQLLRRIHIFKIALGSKVYYAVKSK